MTTENSLQESHEKPINAKALRALLTKADFILGSFYSENSMGYQLTIGLKVPLKANGKRVAERTEWHTVTFGDLPKENPDIRMHASYGDKDAVRIMFLHELAMSEKHQGTPRFSVKHAYWGDTGSRACTFTIAAGTDYTGQTIREMGGACYNVAIGSAHLTLAGFTFEPFAKWRTTPSDWNRDPDSEEHDGTGARYHYKYSRT